MGQLLHRLALPYARLELPGWGKVLRWCGVSAAVEAASRWPRDLTLTGKSHGFAVELDLTKQHERTMYFLGRSEELEIELFFQEAIRQGDAVIDVGANVGMLSLLAARLVGRQGRVFSFEPNPSLCSRLRATFQRNAISNVQLFEMGLADRTTEMELQVLPGLDVLGTLAPVQEAAATTYRVSVRQADDILPAELAGPVLVKIDVEGFEVSVLRGMGGLVERLKPAIVTEVEPLWLARAGTSPRELFEMMAGYGYRGFHLGSKRRGLRRHMCLSPVAHEDALAQVRKRASERNVVWIHPMSIHAARLQKHLI